MSQKQPLILITDDEEMITKIFEDGLYLEMKDEVEIEVTEGMENLSEINQEEIDLGMEGTKRLGCQCVISGGTVKMTF